MIFTIQILNWVFINLTGTAAGTTETNIRVLYFDDIKIGNENATYADMVPTPAGTVTTATNSYTTKTITITPVTPTITMSVTDFKLVNADTEKDVQSIVNGQTISLSALKREQNKYPCGCYYRCKKCKV